MMQYLVITLSVLTTIQRILRSGNAIIKIIIPYFGVPNPNFGGGDRSPVLRGLTPVPCASVTMVLRVLSWFIENQLAYMCS